MVRLALGVIWLTVFASGLMCCAAVSAAKTTPVMSPTKPAYVERQLLLCAQIEGVFTCRPYLEIAKEVEAQTLRHEKDFE